MHQGLFIHVANNVLVGLESEALFKVASNLRGSSGSAIGGLMIGGVVMEKKMVKRYGIKSFCY